ncbi:MAG: hypothetical protein S0880_10320 [Actinomycetota bacterium]|nr:hypothetical protein [Actinomycetota bacterium]
MLATVVLELAAGAAAVAESTGDAVRTYGQDVATVLGALAALVAAAAGLTNARAKARDRDRLDDISGRLGEPNGHGTIAAMLERVYRRQANLERQVRRLDEHGGAALHRLRSTLSDDIAENTRRLDHLVELHEQETPE